jgi:hypothetical protein
MFGVDASAAGRRPGMIAIGLVAGVLSSSVAYSQAAPAGAAPAQAAAAPTTRLFASDGGMVLNFIKPDKGPDFEAVIAKLKEALAKSEKPERKQQAQSWKVFKSPDPAAGGNLLYVFVIDPAVKGADYTVSNILAEAFTPAEVNDLYKKYAEAYATGQNFVNLTLVADLK